MYRSTIYKIFSKQYDESVSLELEINKTKSFTGQEYKLTSSSSTL